MSSRDTRRTKKKTKKQPEEEKQKPAQTHFRHRATYVFSFIILIIIVVTFVGGPALSGVSGNRNLVFGEYANREIRYVQGNYLARQRDILYDQMQNNSNASNQNYEVQAYQVWKGAYDRTVIHTAILVKAERSGVHVSDNLIDQRLLQSGPYMEDGEFSEKRYRDTTASERQRYRDLYREQIIHQQYIEDLTHSGIFSTHAADFLKSMAKTERKFRFVNIDYDQYPDSELTAYGRENEKLFSRIKLSRITVKSGISDAETIRSQIVDGVSTFENQAQNYSEDRFSDKGGEMGWREYHELQADFGTTEELDELFALDEGNLSPVYETDFGWVFYRVDEEAVAPDFSNEETLGSIRDYMTRFERGRIEDYLSARAEEFRTSASESTFQNAASAAGYDVQETNYFPINYGNAFFLNQVNTAAENTNSIQNAAFSTSFFETLFALDQESISEPVVLDESVAMFELIEERTKSEAELSFIGEYYPYIYQQFLDRDLQEHIFSSEEFEDNFSEVFSRVFLSQ